MKEEHRSVYTVTQISQYIRNMFSQDYLLTRLYIRGEVSNCKYHSSGHIYFSLKDENALLHCVMFAGDRKNLAFRLENGQQVIAFGGIGTYPRDGSYQMIVRGIRLDGLGVLYERFEALKAELEEMGMFDPSYRKPLPYFVRRLGIVTAPTGAAVRDMIQIARRRNPGIQILLYPAKVQGDGAAQSIARGIRALDEAGVDVIIIGRGGGSIEDLWAFNEEIVARAVFFCETPVISAVGHETDTVISDFVADLRAPTPSAGAELAVADVSVLDEQIRLRLKRMARAWEALDGQYRKRLTQSRLRLELFAPGRTLQDLKRRHADLQESMRGEVLRQLQDARRRHSDLQEALRDEMLRRLQDQERAMELRRERLKGLSPLHKLQQGYAFVTDLPGKRVRSVRDTDPGKILRICFADGSVLAQVTEVEMEEAAGLLREDTGETTREG